jgi:hypothetical protein
MSVEWKKQIATAFLVKQKIHELDEEGQWPFHYPELAASEEQIHAVENKLGYSLPIEYRQFLKCANGWQGFYLNVDLFGTEDLLGSSRMTRAIELLEWLEADNVIPSSSFHPELLPIGLSQEDNTLFCLATPLHQLSGQVLWFSGKLIETFPNFREFFLAMCDYSRLEVERLQGKVPNLPS